MEEKIYTTKEFAKAIGISKNHLLKLETEGKVPPAKRQKRGKVNHRYYTVDEIIEFRKILGMPPLIEKRRVQLFLNFKGGTGKSTLSASFAYGLAEMGVEVLAIDLDAQQHMTKCLGYEPKRNAPSIYEVLIEDQDINEVIANTKMATLDIIPGNINLSVIENRLPGKEMKEFLLTSAFNKIQCKNYKIIVIDSLPNITLLNKNAIIAADDLLVPVLPDFLSFDGLGLLFQELSRMETAYAIYADFRGGLLDNIFVFINQYRSHEIMSQQNKKALAKYYSDYLCESIIPYDTKIAQSTAAGMPIFQYQRSSTGARQIRKLMEEILELNYRRNKRARIRSDNSD